MTTPEALGNEGPLDWLKRQTLTEVADWLRREESTSLEHPYGFTVVRLHREFIAGWQVRIHLWPPRGEQEARLRTNGTLEQRVHSHGWRICSVVLLGALEERSFRLASDETSTYGLYTVESDYATGFSRLQLERPKVISIETNRKVRSASSGYLIPTAALHSSMSAEEVWSLSLVLTELAHNIKSNVVAPSSLGSTVLNERRATRDLSQLHSLIDGHVNG
jgi:hypothetical protein